MQGLPPQLRLPGTQFNRNIICGLKKLEIPFCTYLGSIWRYSWYRVFSSFELILVQIWCIFIWERYRKHISSCICISKVSSPTLAIAIDTCLNLPTFELLLWVGSLEPKLKWFFMLVQNFSYWIVPPPAVLSPQVHQEELLRRAQDLLQRPQALQGLRQQQQRQEEARAKQDQAKVKYSGREIWTEWKKVRPISRFFSEQRLL